MKYFPKRILVLGATSAMIAETLKRLALQAESIVLVARDVNKLNAIKSDLGVVSNCLIEILQVDFSDVSNLSEKLHQHIVNNVAFDLVLMAQGVMPEALASLSPKAALDNMVNINYTSVVLSSEILKKNKAMNKNSKIAVISSVAGDRGRKSNYLYGSSKSAVSTYLAGLSDDLREKEVSVLTIKPGLVDTPMTVSINKNPLFVSSNYAGQLILKAILNKRGVVYIPRFWALIMFVIRLMPSCILRKLPI